MVELMNRANQVIEKVNKVIIGKEKVVNEIMLAFLANGHVLLEDIPGVGKTTLAMAFSKVMALDCKRVQFTPDVMPSDLTGFSIYNQEKGSFIYRKGSVFCNLLLADEINRTSPKTQSALLEVMEERRVSVEGETRTVPDPFIVIATQNPYGTSGTQYLPEAQVDRFIIMLSLGYPDFESELTMAKLVGETAGVETLTPVMDCADLLLMQKAIHTIFVKDEVYRYIVELVTKTREHPYLTKGASPRATIALIKMAKASAWQQGRRYVTPRDVKEQFPYIIAHRIELSTAAKMEGVDKLQLIESILAELKPPQMGDYRS